MNFSFLDRILASESGFLATVLETDGHTYQKSGARALYAPDEAVPVWGNLGSQCADRDILGAGREALGDGRPRRIHIDMKDENDAKLGYGTACGGAMSLLVEPLLDTHRAVYRDVVRRLSSGEKVELVHDMESGEIAFREDLPTITEAHFVETIHPPPRLVVFGATPLARVLCTMVADMDFSVCLVDWRAGMLDTMADLPRVRREIDRPALHADDYVVLLSHSFDHDRSMLADALRADCRYIGVLSSRQRRDLMFDALAGEGFRAEQLERVSSPIGVDIGARTDPEIAVSIVAELIGSPR